MRPPTGKVSSRPRWNLPLLRPLARLAHRSPFRTLSLCSRLVAKHLRFDFGNKVRAHFDAHFFQLLDSLLRRHVHSPPEQHVFDRLAFIHAELTLR